MYNFDYFYGNEAEQYRFYMIPQLLFTDDKFKKLSSDSKILYSLLLDRAGLSFKNNDRFQDESGRTFIFFKQETAMEMLNCAKEKITKIFKELDDIGLIERKRQGLGKPTRIYVKHFNRMAVDSEKVSEHQEVRKSNFNKFENRTSTGSKIELQDFRKSNTNHTNINHTEFIHTEVNQTAAEAADRATAKNSIEKSFKDVLTEIGYKFPNIPREDFASGFDEQDIDILKGCQIPEHYSSDKGALNTALNFFAEYDYAYNGFSYQADKILYKQIIDCLRK